MIRAEGLLLWQFILRALHYLQDLLGCVGTLALSRGRRFGSCSMTAELVGCLTNDIVHFVGGDWPALVIITLEEMTREVTGGEGATWLIERSTSSMDSLCYQTLLYSRHHGISLNGVNLLLTQCLLLLGLILLSHHHLLRV